MRRRGLVEAFRAGGVLAHLPDGGLDGAGGGDSGDQLALKLGRPAVGALHLADDGNETQQRRDLGIGGERFEGGNVGLRLRMCAHPTG